MRSRGGMRSTGGKGKLDEEQRWGGGGGGGGARTCGPTGMENELIIRT